MTGLSVLLLGIGLGLRHATDADHVVVVSALVQREPGAWRAARIAAVWGVGHTAAFFIVGALIVLAGVRVPAAFELATEVAVAAMLVGFGVWHLVRESRERAAAGARGTRISDARPFAIGVVHGLAGSAAIGLVAASTIPSRWLAVAYLLLFGVGTVVGMVLLTVLLSRPIGWTMRRDGLLKRAVTVAAALLSIALGASIGVDVLTGW